MRSHQISERAKPFRLVKYFSFSSLILIFFGTIILSFLNTHWIRSMQFTKSEDYALLLIENLNHQVFMQFILPVGLKYGKIELRNREQYERMDSVVRSTLHSFKVDLVNIYGMKDQVAYSYSKELIGQENLGGTGFAKALHGEATSRLVQKGSFWELLMGVPKEIKIVTFAPLRAAKPLSSVAGPVLGVVEIVQDLSNDYKSIFRFQVLTLITVSGVMLVLFLIMTIVVKRGESIIQRRAQERLKLKEQLSRAKHLSSLLKIKMGPDNTSARIPDIIIEESGRLNNIITDFLNYARPREPNLFPCSVIGVIDKIIAYLSSQMENEGHTIHTEYDRNVPKIHADADMLYQAFLNILLNAMQAMPDGGVIDITAFSRDSHLWITFEDHGPGIQKEAMGKMWDPFFTTKDKGTGLGLGIVKNIIEAHNGKIRIENRSKGGTRVAIRLPVDMEA
ncbi:MAG: ATP-binding protein [Desulfobacteraceae bacterium]